MILLTFLSLIAYYCANDLLIDRCEIKMSECLDRKTWEYVDKSPLLYPSEEVIEEMARECREEVR